MCTESMTICYCIIIMWCLFLASFWFSVIANSREPFSMTCPIGTSSLAFVRVTRIFSIVRAGFIRGERQSICLMTISSYCLRQSLCFKDVYPALRQRLCFINNRATNLWRVYQLRERFKIINFTCFVLQSLSIQHVALISDFSRHSSIDSDRLWYFLLQCLRFTTFNILCWSVDLYKWLLRVPNKSKFLQLVVQFPL